MSKSKEAVDLFYDGFLCSQAVLSIYSEQFGMDRELSLKISEGLGGGMGRMGLTCGAVTGAYLVISLKYGSVSAEDMKSREQIYTLIKKFTKQFKSRNGSIVCRELLGCNIGESEGYEEAKEKNIFKEICPKFVEDAVELLELLLKDEF